MERNVKRVKVINPCVLIYGTDFKCNVSLRKGQVCYLLSMQKDKVVLEKAYDKIGNTFEIDIERFNKTFMED